MKHTTRFWLALIVALLCLVRGASAAGPVVSNVRVTTRADSSGRVDIYYDLHHPQGLSSTVTLHLSKDGGATYPFGVSAVTGDVGAGVLPGTNRYVEWNAAAEYGGEHISRASIQVEATGPGDTSYDEITLTLPGGVPLVLVRISAGSFQMGSPDTERSRDGDEGPVHPVTINYDFYMGKYEVTQAQWLAVMGSWPSTAPSSSYGVGDNYPAYYVSWNDAQNFITALNTHITSTGQGPATVRLPSEAEWEYACRAGTQTRFYFGDSLSVADYCEDDGIRSQYMWYCGNNPGYGETGYGSKPVGGKLPNAFGLHDMSGNVWEWCQDWYHSRYTGAPADGSAWESPTGSYRVHRGGNWFDHARYCRSANRSGGSPGARYHALGFRLAAWPAVR